MKNFIIIVLIVIAAVLIILGLMNNQNKGFNNEVETEANSQTDGNEVVVDDADNQIYQLDPESSSLNWSARRIVGNSHTGTVEIKEGSLIKTAADLTGGRFVIDMTTITESNSNQTFLTHIKSDDFFAVADYPESIFTIKQIAEQGDDNYLINGDLTIRGLTKEISFPATITEIDDRLMAKAEFIIDRTDWNINFDSGSIFTNLGDKAIRDEIEYSLELEFVPA